MDESDITTSAAGERAGQSDDLTYPFAYEISAMNAVVKLLGGTELEIPVRPADDPSADLRYPFANDLSALNAIARIVYRQTRA